MLKVVIVEKNPQMAELIMNIIDSSCPEVEITSIVHNLQSAFLAIPEHLPDIVLLDIDMLKKESFHILEKLEVLDFKLILTTASSKCAIQAVKLNALDYILKPIKAEDLISAILKVDQVIEKTKNEQRLKELRNNFNTKQLSTDKIVLKTHESIYIVNINDIVRCESGGSYTYFYLHNKKKITVSKLLKEYDDILQNQGFLRIHQSHLININFIDRFDKKNGGMLLMQDGSEVPVSFRKKESFFKLIEEF